MNPPAQSSVRAAMLALAAAIAAAIATARAQAEPAQWPVTENIAGYIVSAYEPQVIAWPSHTRLYARLAFAITRPGTTRPYFGVMNVSGDSTADYAASSVAISNIRITAVSLPSVPADQAQALQRWIFANLQFPDRSVPLDAVEVGVKHGENAARTLRFNAQAPIIEYSATPAVLVVFDGDALFSPVKGVANLQFAVNANWPVFKTGNEYYLLCGWKAFGADQWLRADTLAGPWRAAGPLPAALQQLPDDVNWSSVRAALNAPFRSPAPKVWVTTRPAEAIVTSGPPRLVGIRGTRIAYVGNTSAALFFSNADGRYYYLTSGRWFSARDLTGTWTPAGDALPLDFAAIPPDSARGWVLANVPGTPQARSAVLAADLPHSASVNRATAALHVSYAGDPILKSIELTTLEYVANTSFDVFKFGDQYYACDLAVWYVSKAPSGPWSVADRLPSVIYTIPSTSPFYPDTYVTIDGSDANSVTDSYTSGYLGSFALNGALTFGTGWWTPPYIAFAGEIPTYFPWPFTYLGGLYYDPSSAMWRRGYAVEGAYGRVRRAESGPNFAQMSSIYGWGLGDQAVYDPATNSYLTSEAAWGSGCAPGAAGCIASATEHYGSRTYGNGVSIGKTPYAVSRPGVTPIGSAVGLSIGATGWHPPANPSDVYAASDGNVYRPATAGQWLRYDNVTQTWHTVAAVSRDLPEDELLEAALARAAGIGQLHGR